MTTKKVLLVNQAVSEVSAFDSERIPYTAVYVAECSAEAAVEPFVGPHTYFAQTIADLPKFEEVLRCTYLASYRDGSAKLCNEAQKILNIDSNCHSEYFNFFHDKLTMNEILSELGENRHFGPLRKHEFFLFPGKGRYIFKPRSLQGSLGVQEFQVNNVNDWQIQINNYLSLGRNSYCKEGYLWENFVSGHEYSVDVYLHDGVVHLLGFASKGTCFSGNFVESSHVVGDIISDSLSSEVLHSLNKIFKSVGYRNGPAHVEFKVNSNNQIHYIEFHPRPGGDNLVELILMANGTSLVEHLQCHINKIPVKQSTHLGLFSSIQYLCTCPSPADLESLAKFPELQIKTNLAASETISSSSDRPAFVAIRGVSIERMLDLYRGTSSIINWDQLELIKRRSEGLK